MSKFIRHISILSIILLSLTLSVDDSKAIASPSVAEKQNTASKGKTKRQAAKKAASSKKKSSPKKKKSGKAQKAKKETSADVKKKEQAAQTEIRLTRQQIEANEKEVKANLSLLSEIQSGIDKSKQHVTSLQNRAVTLEAEIEQCNAKIAQSEKRIETLRLKYIAAVKKMRTARRKTSTLAFIFSSKNFYQAWRRMRYMQKFSDWRERQVGKLRNEIEQLNLTTRQLTDKKMELDDNLAKQMAVKKDLETKYTRQDEVVVKLKANGDAMRTHLARKQQEAAALSNRVAQLIIAEQQAAEAQRRRQEEAARQAEERRRREAELAEQRKKEAEAKAAEEAKRKEQLAQADAQATKESKTKAPKKDNRKDTKKAETKKKEGVKKSKASGDNTSSNKSYAQARQRRPRSKADGNTSGASESKAATTSTTAKKAATSASGFASAKGSLPRPVAGKFTIISKFGRHGLPDLPGVMYDNPGIDALVSPGADAKAVYNGTVSGVYMLNGFSTVVIVNHGDYYTVYGNIGTPSVKKGDSVKQGQSLGKLVSDSDDGGRTTIHFEVWKNREKQNPEAWIR